MSFIFYQLTYLVNENLRYKNGRSPLRFGAMYKGKDEGA